MFKYYIAPEGADDDEVMFQSPRSGQICSNQNHVVGEADDEEVGFNPLDRVKFVQILVGNRRREEQAVSIP